MKHLTCLALFTAALFAPPAPTRAAVPAADQGIFVEGTRYDAVFYDSLDRWRLLPTDGPDLTLHVDESCHRGSPPPQGIWLLTRDAGGQPTLVAPSSTALPEDHPGRVRLLACGQAVAGELPALAVPEALLDWLVTHSGSVYVLAR